MTSMLRVERLVAGGDGLAREEDGRVAFVNGGLPGELVTVETISQKKDFRRVRVTEVIEASADRRDPPCAHRVEGCGGCGWMHLAPEAQLRAKGDIVRESLTRLAKLPAERVDELVVLGAAVDPLGYRTTIRVAADRSGRAGFRAEASDQVVPVDQCRVAHPQLAALLPDLRLPEHAELALRTSLATGESTARWEGRRPPDDRVAGLSPTVHFGDRAWIEERVAGEWFRVSAPSFFQSGPAAAEALVDAVGRLGGDRVSGHAVDAYGGVGLFARTVLAGAARVTLVESSKPACVDARQNLQGVDASVVRSEFGRWDPGGARVDLVVADPARTGLGKPGVAAVERAAPDTLLLVSCDPGSLARDVSLLGERGFRPSVVEVLDLFPETAHVEAVTLFEAEL
jgi:23S rRNA (uracil1939-C5)-methyltransferase